MWGGDGRESSAGQRLSPQILLPEVEGEMERELESAPGSCNLSWVYFRLLPFCLCGCHSLPLVSSVAHLWLPSHTLNAVYDGGFVKWECQMKSQCLGET